MKLIFVFCNRLILTRVLLSILFTSSVSLADPLAAVMTFDSMTITADGVKKQTHFQENFIRDKDTIWSQRIIPAAASHHNTANTETKPEHEHEHNLNFATAGKWLVRDAEQNIKFLFVRSEDKTIIEPRSSEYGTLGFDGVWETAYYLVNRSALSNMTKLNKPAPKGAIWYEQKGPQQFTLILWNEQLQIPLSIETGNIDGSSNNKITIAMMPIPTTFPWQKISHYQTKAYEDLLD